MKKCGIYGIINTLNKKWYIGQSIDVLARITRHLRELSHGKHPNSYLQFSYKKHGADAFESRILEETSEDMLDIRERAWIKHYNSTSDNCGYNLDDGGSFNRKPTKLTREKISRSRMGVSYGPHTKEHKKKISSSLLGRVFSEETKKKISLSKMGHVVSAPTREKLSKFRTGRKFGPRVKK